MLLSRHMATVATLALGLSVGPAIAGTITDGYYGSDDHGYGDVIGDAGKFDVFSATVERVGSTLTVSIATNFAGLGDNKLFTSLTNKDASKLNGVNMGLGYGDLFLGTAWDPDGSAPYLTDDYSTGTQWEYVFSLDNRWAVSGGNGELFGLDPQDPAVLLSEDFLSGGIFRNGQEVAVNIAALDPALSSGSWSVDAVNKLLTFTIDVSGTALANAQNIALHWNMTCGNDTIEGLTAMPVPEPGVGLLTLLGLVGVGASRRRRS
ncbi:MAG: PEP-CTERM sorting domain-containing protein [Pseudomonadota bacterium]|nr:PEP-CTERM sorting domain-containing protein [Pseudomonadota bacterium]